MPAGVIKKGEVKARGQTKPEERSKVAYASSLRRESLLIGIEALDLRGMRKLEACATLGDFAAAPSLNRTQLKSHPMPALPCACR